MTIDYTNPAVRTHTLRAWHRHFVNDPDLIEEARTLKMVHLSTTPTEELVTLAHEAGISIPGVDYLVLSEAERTKAIALVQGMWLDPDTHLTVDVHYVQATIDTANHRIEVVVDAPVPPGRAHLFTCYHVHFPVGWQRGADTGAEIHVQPVGEPLDFSKTLPPGVYS